jgi:hypothetical protein
VRSKVFKGSCDIEICLISASRDLRFMLRKFREVSRSLEGGESSVSETRNEEGASAEEDLRWKAGPEHPSESPAKFRLAVR